MNMTVTDCLLGSVIYETGEFSDELLTFAAEGTVVEGTILARDSSTNKLVPFVKGGTTNGNGIPKAVLTYDVTATGAGDKSIRAAVSGKFRLQYMVIDADGDNSNIDAVVLDELRDYGLVVVDVENLSNLDNI